MALWQVAPSSGQKNFIADYESLEPPEQLCFYKLCSTVNYKIYNIYKVQIFANYYSLRCPEQLCLSKVFCRINYENYKKNH